MLDVVLKDIDPVKATSVKLYLKEMNDLLFLITLGQGPFISDGILSTRTETAVAFEVSENSITAKFKANVSNDKMSSAHFDVFEGEKQLISIAHSVKADAPIAMRIILDSDGEILARKEVEKKFTRSIAHQNIQYLQGKSTVEEGPLSAPVNDVDEVVQKEVENQLKNDSEIELKAENITELNEISEEINALSERVMQSMQEVRDTIEFLNELSHDFTRGEAPNISAIKLDEQELENGAKIQLFDVEENGYLATFRKGSLNNMTEISFFLEKNGELIFSTYFSSLGNGKIGASGQNAEQMLKRLKVEIAN